MGFGRQALDDKIRAALAARQRQALGIPGPAFNPVPMPEAGGADNSVPMPEVGGAPNSVPMPEVVLPQSEPIIIPNAPQARASIADTGPQTDPLQATRANTARQSQPSGVDQSISQIRERASEFETSQGERERRIDEANADRYAKTVEAETNIRKLREDYRRDMDEMQAQYDQLLRQRQELAQKDPVTKRMRIKATLMAGLGQIAQIHAAMAGARIGNGPAELAQRQIDQAIAKQKDQLASLSERANAKLHDMARARQLFKDEQLAESAVRSMYADEAAAIMRSEAQKADNDRASTLLATEADKLQYQAERERERMRRQYAQQRALQRERMAQQRALQAQREAAASDPKLPRIAKNVIVSDPEKFRDLGLSKNEIAKIRESAAALSQLRAAVRQYNQIREKAGVELYGKDKARMNELAAVVRVSLKKMGEMGALSESERAELMERVPSAGTIVNATETMSAIESAATARLQGQLDPYYLQLAGAGAPVGGRKLGD